LNSQIEIRVVTRTFSQDTFELTSTVPLIFKFCIYKFLDYVEMVIQITIHCIVNFQIL